MKIRTLWRILFLAAVTTLGGCGGSTSGDGTLGYFVAGENGITTSPWGDGSPSLRPAMAVKFTPSTYPLTISSVTVYAVNGTGSDQMFNLRGFGENLSAETEIFPAVQNQVIPSGGASRYVKTVTIPATTITSGSFHIAVEWVTKPLASALGANTFFLCTDSSLDHPATSYFRFAGTIWSTVESISATAGDVGIVVNY